MNKKKLTIISVVLIMIMAVGGVLAYLTSTASVTNTFTVGDVDITLDEAVVDENGVVDPDAGRTEEGNQYHLIPGQKYVKDPMITVIAGSEESYVRMILQVTNKDAVDAIIAAEKNQLTDYADLFDGWMPEVWLYEGYVADDEANTIDFEFRYYTTVDGIAENGKDADAVLQPLFTKLVVPEFINNEELAALQECNVIVTGHAIQAVGFEDTKDENGTVIATAEDNAWKAFDAQKKAEK